MGLRIYGSGFIRFWVWGPMFISGLENQDPAILCLVSVVSEIRRIPELSQLSPIPEGPDPKPCKKGS